MIKTPSFIYGTAWKEDRTPALVTEALQAGFRAIDTANQRKHYFEEGVGQALLGFYEGGGKREELFLQTKFTYLNGQDQRLPYDAHADLKTQVRQSFQSSLTHLHTDYLDSYVLHGPHDYWGGFSPEDRAVWETMEELHASGRVHKLGVSNVHLGHLEEMLRTMKVKPSFVQNRCYAKTGWDHEVRAFCTEHEIVYQGFSLLTANLSETVARKLFPLSGKYRKTIPQIVFNFSMQVGMLPLTGTSDPVHMREDLESANFKMDEEDVQFIEHILI